MTSVHDLKLVEVSSFSDGLGDLVALEEEVDLPIRIKRVFVVSGSPGVTRGKHAHKQLTQILVCVHGSCKVLCDDGSSTKEFILDGIDQLLIIPPGIWAEQTYSTQNTVLMVLCDLPFDEGDYIRDREEFIAYRKEWSA